MSVPKCLFFQDLEALTEVFGGMSAGMSCRKLPLWAEFSFLTDAGGGVSFLNLFLVSPNLANFSDSTVVAVIITVLIPRNYMAVTLLITVL